MHQHRILGVLFILLVLPGLAASAWDTRLFSLDGPSLSLSGAVPNGLGAVIFPTDEYGLGLSAVADPLDIFILPQQLANATLFPSNAIIVDASVNSVETPNGGVVLGFSGQQLVMGLFIARPSLNGWVTGSPRSAFGLGASYFTSAGVGVVAPTVPVNLADFILAMKLGGMLVGGSLGFSFSQAASDSTSIVGSADSTTTDKSSSWVITGRAGASLPLGPVALDASVLMLLANAGATRVSGAAAAAPSLNNSLSALDFSFSVNGRATMALAPTMDLVALAAFALLPQNYSAATAAGALTTANIQVDSSGFLSFGAGAGVNWKPTTAVLVNALFTAVFGSGTWVDFAAGVTPRPTSSVVWLTLRPVLDAEIKAASWLTVRGGVSAFVRWVGTTLAANTGGTTQATGPVQIGVSADAGLGFQLTDKIALDVLVNLANLDGTGGAFQVPGLSTSLKVDL